MSWLESSNIFLTDLFTSGIPLEYLAFCAAKIMNLLVFTFQYLPIGCVIRSKFLYWCVIPFWFSLSLCASRPHVLLLSFTNSEFQPSSTNCRSSKILLLLTPPPAGTSTCQTIKNQLKAHTWVQWRGMVPEKSKRMGARQIWAGIQAPRLTGDMTLKELLQSLTRIRTRNNGITAISMSQGYWRN